MCGSSRRRPITSPPGGGTTGSAEAREEWPREEERGSNPAPELAVELVAREVGGVDADLVPARPLNVRAELGEERDHRLDVADARHVRERHRFVGEQAGREDRQGAVLVPGRGDPAVQRMPALDHERLGNGFGDDGLRHARGYPSAVVEPTRERAWETLNRYTKSEALLRHALAVEAAVGAYAQRFEEDEELWRVTALLHDFDYEIHPTLDKHPQDGAPILREEGYPEEVIEGVLSHGSHLGLPRDTPLKKTLFACDELAGFVHACGLVRPDGIETLEPKSVKKKLKQPSFAAGVNRAGRLRRRRGARGRVRRAHRLRGGRDAPDRGRARASQALRQSVDEAFELLVGRPPAARSPEPAERRDVAHDARRARRAA